MDPAARCVEMRFHLIGYTERPGVLTRPCSPSLLYRERIHFRNCACRRFPIRAVVVFLKNPIFKNFKRRQQDDSADAEHIACIKDLTAFSWYASGSISNFLT